MAVPTPCIGCGVTTGAEGLELDVADPVTCVGGESGQVGLAIESDDFIINGSGQLALRSPDAVKYMYVSLAQNGELHPATSTANKALVSTSVPFYNLNWYNDTGRTYLFKHQMRYHFLFRNTVGLPIKLAHAYTARVDAGSQGVAAEPSYPGLSGSHYNYLYNTSADGAAIDVIHERRWHIHQYTDPISIPSGSYLSMKHQVFGSVEGNTPGLFNTTYSYGAPNDALVRVLQFRSEGWAYPA